ncbi:MAG TPA: SDR family oxidoreductase [Terriglobales bacterium]|nr:SDR family oxidoreductase [Terriglobales bacterium]
MQNVIILGATSGIVQPLERLMAADGKELLLVGRSQERLDTLAADLASRGARVLTCVADLSDMTQHRRVLQFAREKFPDFDTLLLAYGTLLDQEQCQVSPERAVEELNTNFVSAAALLTLFAGHFEARKAGTIAVITSVAGDRGRRSNYVYGAAKGGLSLFLQGLRGRMYLFGVRVLTIKPGPVHTAMTAHMKKSRMFVEPETAARQIYRALQDARAEVVYVPGRWKWIMRVIRAIPERSFKKLSM